MLGHCHGDDNVMRSPKIEAGKVWKRVKESRKLRKGEV